MFTDHTRQRWLRAPFVMAVVSGLGLCLAAPALAESAAEIEARTAPAVAGTPCTAAAHACVDVNKKQAWLIKDGKIFRGPVPISTGGKGKDTPTGNVFRVYRKDKMFKSTEFKLPNGQPAPMPNAVFFEDGGIAFHSGNPRLASAGCVHLNPADSLAFFNYLQIGDHVQVFNGPVAAPPPQPTDINASTTSGSDDSSSDDSDTSDDSDNSKDQSHPDRGSHHKHHGSDDN